MTVALTKFLESYGSVRGSQAEVEAALSVIVKLKQSAGSYTTVAALRAAMLTELGAETILGRRFAAVVNKYAENEVVNRGDVHQPTGNPNADAN